MHGVDLAGRLVVRLQDDHGVERRGCSGRPQQLLVGLTVALVRQVDDGFDLLRPRPDASRDPGQHPRTRVRSGRRGARRGRAEPDRDTHTGRGHVGHPVHRLDRGLGTASSQTGCQSRWCGGTRWSADRPASPACRAASRRRADHLRPARRGTGRPARWRASVTSKLQWSMAAFMPAKEDGSARPCSGSRRPRNAGGRARY